MEMTIAHVDPSTMDGYQSTHVNVQELIYDVANSQTSEENCVTDKKKKCYILPLLVTALITAVMSSGITYLTIHILTGARTELCTPVRDGTQQGNCNCEPPWLVFNCRYYYFSHRFLTWENAQMDCQSRKSNLVKIDDNAENNWLIKMLNDKLITNHTWIGANDIAQSNVWVWVSDKSKVNYTAWDDHQPSGIDKYDGKKKIAEVSGKLNEIGMI